MREKILMEPGDGEGAFISSSGGWRRSAGVGRGGYGRCSRPGWAVALGGNIGIWRASEVRGVLFDRLRSEIGGLSLPPLPPPLAFRFQLPGNCRGGGQVEFSLALQGSTKFVRVSNE